MIGTDGGLIERPETVTEAFFAPGERLDVLIDAGQAQPGEAIFLKSLAFDAMENESSVGGTSSTGSMGGMGGATREGMGQMMGGMSSSRLPLGQAFNVLKLEVGSGERIVPNMPAMLSVVKPIDIASAAERKVENLNGTHAFFNQWAHLQDG